MPTDLSETLVIGITSTALFDLSEADRIFHEGFDLNRAEGVRNYRKYMLEHENDKLEDGTAMPLVNALLQLNEHQQSGKPPYVEVVVMSRNSPETGVLMLNNIRERNLNISRSAFTGGETVVPYLKAFDVDLFLTTTKIDAVRVIDSDTCAAAILKEPPKSQADIPEGQVRIAFDGDAVLFSEKSEIVYRTEGLETFQKIEDSQQNVPLEDGPYASLLRKLAKLQEEMGFTVEMSPVRIAIVTARNAPAEMRVIKTLRHWGVYVDEIFFLGGVEKVRVLEAFRPHIFFDDQDIHLDPASGTVPSGKVPHKTGSPLKGDDVEHT